MQYQAADIQDINSHSRPAVQWYMPWVLAGRLNAKLGCGRLHVSGSQYSRIESILAGGMHSTHDFCCKAGHKELRGSPEAATGASSSTGSARPSSLARYILVTDASATALAYHREPAQATWSCLERRHPAASFAGHPLQA